MVVFLYATIVRDLHAKSGLTWEQLGRLLGVSRRAVHLWAAGGRINSRHIELLAQLRGIIDNLPAEDAAQRRMLIFQARQAEPSIFDAFLTYSMLGARYDKVESDTL